MNIPTVAITSYQRPEFLVKRVAEIMQWRVDSRIIVSVDGLRKRADSKEESRRDLVISEARQLQLKNENITIYEWTENTGLNHHASRLFNTLAQSFDEVIIVEDDVSLGISAFEFLNENCRSSQAFAASAYLSHSHKNLDQGLYRETLFPQQWGVALRKEILEDYCRLIKDRKLNRRVLRENLHLSLEGILTFFQIERLTQWWYNHFYFCLIHGSWPDALIQYCVIASGKQYRVPARSLAFDINSIGDQRSLNPRTTNEGNLHCLERDLIVRSGVYSCKSCEIRNCNIENASLRNIIGGTRHRLKLSNAHPASL